MKVLTITAENFRPYGCLIDFPRKDTHAAKGNLFRIVLTQAQRVGWRIAYLVTRDKAIDTLEQHTDTYESFEPVKGGSLLYVSRKKDARAIRCFCLDKPVILKKGIWHGVVAKGRESEIKITENAQVKCIYWKPGARLDSRGMVRAAEDK